MAREAVTNTSPLIALASIDRLTLLDALFERVSTTRRRERSRGSAVSKCAVPSPCFSRQNARDIWIV